MLSEIESFFRAVAPRLGLAVYYMVGKDRWLITKNGKILQGFSTKTFYSLPKRSRMNDFEPLLKIGLANNMGGEKMKNQVYLERVVGRRII